MSHGMRQRRKASLAVIFTIVFIDLIGFGIVIPVLPLYAERFGASPLTIGILLAIYSLMQMLFAPILGRWSDRIGRRPVLLVSILGSSAGFLLMGLAHALPLLFLARIIDGITGGNISTAQAYIADITPPEQRSKGMGLIGAAFGLGFIFGPAIGGLMSRFSMNAPFFFAAGLAAMNAVAVYLFLPESLAREHRTPGGSRATVLGALREALGTPLAVVMGTYFFTTVAFSMLTAAYPLFAARRYGFHAAEIGAIFAGMGVLGAVIQGGMIGWMGRFLSEQTMTLSGCVILAAGFFLLPGAAGVKSLVVASALLAIGHSLTVVPLNGMASRSLGASAQGRVLGLMQSSASLARIAGPVLGGWLLDWDLVRAPAFFGRSAWWMGTVLALVGMGLALSLRMSGECAKVPDPFSQGGGYD